MRSLMRIRQKNSWVQSGSGKDLPPSEKLVACSGPSGASHVFGSVAQNHSETRGRVPNHCQRVAKTSTLCLLSGTRVLGVHKVLRQQSPLSVHDLAFLEVFCERLGH